MSGIRAMSCVSDDKESIAHSMHRCITTFADTATHNYAFSKNNCGESVVGFGLRRALMESETSF
jgi:hypothetical protein